MTNRIKNLDKWQNDAVESTKGKKHCTIVSATGTGNVMI